MNNKTFNGTASAKTNVEYAAALAIAGKAEARIGGIVVE